MRKILEADETNGETFYVSGGEYQVLILRGAGATVRLQARAEAGKDWVNTDASATNNDLISITLAPGFEYRMNSNSAQGSEAWISTLDIKGGGGIV